MQVTDVMTHSVVTAGASETLRAVGERMRELNVGSVVVEERDQPVGVITDRDLALILTADGVDSSQPVGPYATRPLITGEVGMDVEEAVALMVQHRIRRLPLLDGDALAGIVTIDDLAVRAGDLNLAQHITAEVAKAAIPEFFFHRRGG